MSAIRFRAIALALIFAAQCVTAAQNTPASTDDGAAAVRQEFVAAMRRVSSHAAEPPDSAALIAYPIYDYLLAARLRRDLVEKPGNDRDASIDGFLQDRPYQPVTRALRHDWLLSLAARGRWDWFLPRATDITDPVLVCDRLAGRLATGDTSTLAAEALPLWLQPARQPHECDVVFAWLRAQGLLTPDAAEQRMHAALVADNARLAREFSVDVPPPKLPPLEQWLRLLESPKASVLDLAAHVDTPVAEEALIAGFARLSRNDPASALSVLPMLLQRPSVTPALAGQLRRLAALGAAYDHDPGALDAFRALSADVTDAGVREWRVRAALWAQDFDAALKWIDELPETLAAQPHWRYWRARATEATLGSAVAGPLFSEIAGMRDYHGYLAADRLHSSYDLNRHASPDDGEAQKTLELAPGLVRARELFECDLLEDAAVEWSAVLADAAPATKVQAAHLAARWGWYAQAITMLAQAGEWDDLALRYPRPYAAAVARASALTHVPSDWIFSVMRQESLFRRDATSRADARGLMQLQFATATAVARRWHLGPLGHDALFEPSTAIPLGAAYLRELLDRYHGELALALAAYNAGPLAVARWLPHEPMDADIWIENIPYNETRNYVQRVLEHIEAYSADHDAPPPRLSALLSPVTPGAASLADPSPAHVLALGDPSAPR